MAVTATRATVDTQLTTEANNIINADLATPRATILAIGEDGTDMALLFEARAALDNDNTQATASKTAEIAEAAARFNDLLSQLQTAYQDLKGLAQEIVA